MLLTILVGCDQANDTDRSSAVDGVEHIESGQSEVDHPQVEGITSPPEDAGFSYYCPMHDDVTSHEAGSCPKCGMFLVASPLKSNYYCPMHEDVTSHEAGSCPKCGMFLVENSPTNSDESDEVNDRSGYHHHHDMAHVQNLTPTEPDTEALSEIALESTTESLAKPLYACATHTNVMSDTPNKCHICGLSMQKTDGVDSAHTQEAANASEPISVNDMAVSELTKVGKSVSQEEQKSLFICPMHPEIVRDHKANCPICGMYLEPQQASSEGGNSDVVLTAATVQKMGVVSERVIRGNINKPINTVGIITYNEDRFTDVAINTFGWVENVTRLPVGYEVTRGQLMVELYSPEFYELQDELLDDTKRQMHNLLDDNGQPYASLNTIDYLRYINVPDSTVYKIKREQKKQYTIPLLAPHHGIIVKRNVKKMMFAKANHPFMTIADLSSVWVETTIPESQLQFIERKIRATVTVDSIPGKEWRARLIYVDSALDQHSNALKARFMLPNPERELHPNMIAHVKIHTKAKEDTLMIPKQALIATGDRQSVIMDVGGGRYRPVDVVAGIRSDKEVEILEGLSENDRVVVSGQFLIDSEANLQASFRRLTVN